MASEAAVPEGVAVWLEIPARDKQKLKVTLNRFFNWLVLLIGPTGLLQWSLPCLVLEACHERPRMEL